MKKLRHAREVFTIPGTFALADDEKPGTFEGVALTFNSLVNTWPLTKVLPGAFTKTLQENAERVRLLREHDRYQFIGFPAEMKETEEGLYVKGRLSDSAAGRDALADMRLAKEMGKKLDLSIGFDPIVWEMQSDPADPTREPVRMLKELRLWEISVVAFGAEPKAKVLNVASLIADPSALVELADPEIVIAFARSVVERFAGKVLSEKNRGIVTSARSAVASMSSAAADVLKALDDLLAAAEPPAKSAPDADAEGAALTRARSESAVHVADMEARFALIGGK